MPRLPISAPRPPRATPAPRRAKAAPRRATAGRSPILYAVALAMTALACASVAACESEDPECSKDTDCQEITCGDGTKMQGCSDGECLQGTDCKKEADGGW